MSKQVFKTIIDILLLPFTKHFYFFIVFFVLATSCHVYLQICADNANIAIAILMHDLSISYITTLFLCFIKLKAVRDIIQAIFVTITATVFALNFYCLYQFQDPFDVDFAHLILETNTTEAKEFITSMLPMGVIGVVGGVFLLIIFIWWGSNRYSLNLNLNRKKAMLALGAVCISIAGNLYHWSIWKDGPWAPFFKLPGYNLPLDLKSYYSHLKFTYEDGYEKPLNVVIIIGESFTRSHSSIYGYEKATNPELTQLKNSSILFAFDSINSPAHSTSRSIIDMLSIYNLSDSILDKKWYEFPSIIEIMHNCGYQCFWFENQGSAGIHGAPSRVYAQTCDYQSFLGGIQYDIVLVDSSYKYVKQVKPLSHNLFIFHMYGSHFDFSKRYPQEFAKFSTNDYPSEPENHRQLLSSYDNSILYNDYVVKRIIDLFIDRESVVIYLPDHGQVMYRNKNQPDFYAHGVPIDPDNYALGVDIPFFIYASPLFQQKHPDVMERIKNRQENPKSWNSEDLPYFIMDLIGVKTINGEDVRPRSVLN